MDHPSEILDEGFLRANQVLRYIPVSKTTWWKGGVFGGANYAKQHGGYFDHAFHGARLLRT